MQEFFTWAMLATYAGAVLATTLITQMLKGVPFFDRLPTRVCSYAVAVIIMLVATAVMDGLTPQGAALCLINAVVVSLASNGAFDGVMQDAE